MDDTRLARPVVGVVLVLCWLPIALLGALFTLVPPWAPLGLVILAAWAPLSTGWCILRRRPYPAWRPRVGQWAAGAYFAVVVLVTFPIAGRRHAVSVDEVLFRGGTTAWALAAWLACRAASTHTDPPVRR